ncbi:hypothetical protein [Streptomyces stelliscabiei]|uniref:hypothetical protein n=1 Tax=Streptomyces stelliscabiei TaxID=146820 RepID=UPI002FF21C83
MRARRRKPACRATSRNVGPGRRNNCSTRSRRTPSTTASYVVPHSASRRRRVRSLEACRRACFDEGGHIGQALRDRDLQYLQQVLLIAPRRRLLAQEFPRRRRR